MGVLSTILGSGDVIEKGIDLIDSFHTSDTEEIEAKTKAKVDMMKAYAPFKIAQRVIAFMFISVFLFCFIVSLGFILYAWSQGTLGSADQVNIVSAIVDLMSAFKIPWAMLTIVTFYFGAGAVEGIMERRAEKKG